MLNEATLQFIRNHRLDDVRKLALHAQSLASPEVDVLAAFTQIEGRQSAENKLPTWFQSDDIIYPAALSMEQCSSEQTARYKASLLSGNAFVDLTGGFGVDFAFIAPKFNETYYVEKQTALCELAAHNFKVLGLNPIKIENADAIEYLKKMAPVDAIFMDPARRSDTGKKVVAIENCEPDLSAIQNLLLEKAESVLIKLSPMLDISQALQVLKNVAEVHVVSLDNECKELLFLLKRNFNQETNIICINLNKKGERQEISFLQSQEKEWRIEYTSQVENYLYEPNVSILKAGFFKGLTGSYPIRKFHPDSHLYTSKIFVPDFPGRSFQVETCSSFNKKDLKNLLCGMDKANLAIRNFPLSVAELRKKLKLKEGGEDYLFATTLANGKHVIVKGRRT
ncbi:MAG: SAM-dependent methyltransferase [Tannerella sp.]|jgi:16S rRNA G966 N2-methylase RsmD|nr:SAM-dependent methyltransferase [Tannerella sp.]